MSNNKSGERSVFHCITINEDVDTTIFYTIGAKMSEDESAPNGQVRACLNSNCRKHQASKLPEMTKRLRPGQESPVQEIEITGTIIVECRLGRYKIL